MSEEGLLSFTALAMSMISRTQKHLSRRPHPAQFSYTERWGSGNPAPGQLLQGLDQSGYSLRQLDTLLSPHPHPL